MKRLFATIDWRIKVVFTFLILAVIASVIVYWNGLGSEPSTFFGAVFASWVGGLALFVVVGLVGTAVSLTSPHKDTFDARARILFRRQSGKHIDYIISRIQAMLEHYAEFMVRRVTIREYHEQEKKYLVEVESSTKLRSYIDDIVSTYKSKFVCNKCSKPPAGHCNRLIFIKIDEKPQGDGAEFETEFLREFDTTIEPGSSCIVKTCHAVWVTENEAITLTPIRYTQSCSLAVENRTPKKHVLIKLTEQEGPEDQVAWSEVKIAPGENRKILHRRDLPPHKLIYDFRVIGS